MEARLAARSMSLAKTANDVLTKALKYTPPGADLSLKETLTMEKEVLYDLYNAKRTEPVAKMRRELELILPHLSALEDILGTVGVEAGSRSSGGTGSVEDIVTIADEEGAQWEPVALLPVEKKGTKKKGEKRGSSLPSMKISKTVVVQAAAATKKTSEALARWAWGQAEAILNVYLVLLHIVIGLLPALLLNLGLAAGLCLPVLVLWMPEEIGSGIGNALHDFLLWFPKGFLNSFKLLLSEATRAAIYGPKVIERVMVPTEGHALYDDAAAQVAAAFVAASPPSENSSAPAASPQAPIIIHHQPPPAADSLWLTPLLTAISSAAAIWWVGRAAPYGGPG